MRLRFTCYAALTLLCALACGADKPTLADLSIGKTIFGPALKAEDLKGKVVLVDFWGSDGAPGIKAMPEMSTLYEKYRDEGLHVVAVNVHGDSEEAARGALIGKKLKQQIVTSGQFKGVTSYPKRVLIGHDGNLIDDDVQPNDFEKKIKTALAAKNAAIAGRGPYKKLIGLAVQARTGRDLGAVMKLIAAKKESKDADEATEAENMYIALASAAQSKIDEALKMKATDVNACLAKLNAVAVQFAGSEMATKAQKEAEAIKKDPKTAELMQAEAMLADLLALESTLRPPPAPKKGAKTTDAKDTATAGTKNPEFRASNAATIQRIIAGCTALSEKFPMAYAASRAEDMMNAYK